MYDLKKLTPEEIAENKKLIEKVENGEGLPFLKSEEEIDWAHVDPYPRRYLKFKNKKVYKCYCHPYTHLSPHILRCVEYSHFNKSGTPF